MMNQDNKMQIIKLLNGTIVHSGKETSIVGLSPEGQEILECVGITARQMTVTDDGPEEYVVSDAEVQFRVEIILKDLEQDNLLIAEGPDAEVYSHKSVILTDKPNEIQSFLNDEYNFRYNYDAWFAVRHLYKWTGMSASQEKEAFSDLHISYDMARPGGSGTYIPDGVDCSATITDIYHQDNYEFCGHCHEVSEKCDLADVNGVQICTQCFTVDDLDHFANLVENEIMLYSFAIHHALRQSSWFLLLKTRKTDKVIPKIMDALFIEMPFIAIYGADGLEVEIWIDKE